MSCFAPYNLYTFLAARGAFLRPDVRAALEQSSVDPFDDLATPGRAEQSQGAAFLARLTRKHLDALLFSNDARHVRHEP